MHPDKHVCEYSGVSQFLERNQRIRLEGRVDEMYFNLSGNNIRSSGVVKMKYYQQKRLPRRYCCAAAQRLRPLCPSNASTSHQKDY